MCLERNMFRAQCDRSWNLDNVEVSDLGAEALDENPALRCTRRSGPHYIHSCLTVRLVFMN